MMPIMILFHQSDSWTFKADDPEYGKPLLAQ